MLKADCYFSQQYPQNKGEVKLGHNLHYCQIQDKTDIKQYIYIYNLTLSLLSVSVASIGEVSRSIHMRNPNALTMIDLSC